MSQIGDLKAKPANTFNFIELIQRFSDEEDTTYIKLIDKLIKERINQRVSKTTNPMFGDNVIENAFISMLFSNFVLPDEMASINYFCTKHKSNAITGVDLQKVDINTVVNKATVMRKKELETEKQNMIEIIHEDEDWLLLLPLSYEASLKYGASTKWCTASKNDDSHYHSYSKKGILIYCINKKNNVKYGFYKDLEHKSASYNPTSAISLWDTKDEYVELIEADMPMEILKVLSAHVKNNQTNNKQFKKDKYNNVFKNKSNVNFGTGSDPEVIELTRGANSLAAVKLLKEKLGLGIKEAKIIFDRDYKVYYPLTT